MTTIKETTNGWDGYFAKQTIKLIDGGNGIYLVTNTNSSKHEVRIYRTLKGAEKRFNLLDYLMVKKVEA